MNKVKYFLEIMNTKLDRPISCAYQLKESGMAQIYYI